MLFIKTDTRELTINDEHSEKYFDMVCRAMLHRVFEPPLEGMQVMMDAPEEPPHEEDHEIIQVPFQADPPREVRYPKTDPIFERKSDVRETYREFDKENLGFKGFMHITCSRCGRTKTFFAKEHIKKFFCKECDKETELCSEGMRKAYANCKCGNKAFYWTNSVEGEFDIACINCGAPVSVIWNSKKKCYETMRG